MEKKMADYIDREVVMKVLNHEFVDADTGTPMDFYNIAIKTVRRMIEGIPAADVQPVVRCKDCVYRPYYEPSDSKSASDLVFPDYRFNLCPCRVEDFWYSWMPDDDWFCAYGKRMDGEENG